MRTIWTALLVLLLSVGAAHAQTDDEALIHHGVELRKQGLNAEALAEFERADAAHPSLRAKAQIALAQQALGRWVEAETGLVAVLADENDTWIARNRQPLQDALETIRDHLGTLEIETNVDGAAIVINGAAAGTSPLPRAVRLVAGTAQIEVQAQGYGAMKREIDVPPRSVVKAAIMVMPPTSTNTPSNPGAVAETAAPDRSTLTHAEAPARAEATPWTHRAGVVALVATVPLLAAGITAHVVRENKASDYNEDARCFKDGLTRDQRCGGLRDAANTAGVIAVIGYAASAAAVITGVTLLLVGKPIEGSEEHARIDAHVDGRSAYISYGAVF
jgi:hypothetical protein